MNEQNEKFNKEKESIKKQTEILELTTMTGLKNLIESFNSRLRQKNQWIGKQLFLNYLVRGAKEE